MEKIILRACKLNFKISLILLRDKLHEIKYKYDVKRARDSNPSVNSSILAFPYVYWAQRHETRTNQIAWIYNMTWRL